MSTMPQFLRIREWSTYQHYKDRSPPWIKLHRELLTSKTWVKLDDAGRTLAVACMLIAAATDNQIPADKEYLQRVAYLNSEPDWQPLIDVGFLEIVGETSEVQAPASTLLATGTKRSSEERREETEERRDRAEADARARDPVPHGTTDEAEIRQHVLTLQAKYPPRAAREDWLTAEKHARHIVAEGDASWDDLAAGVERYALLCRKTNRIVMNPAKFFGDVDKPWAQAWPLPATRAENRLSSNVTAAEEFMRRTEPT